MELFFFSLHSYLILNPDVLSDWWKEKDIPGSAKVIPGSRPSAGPRGVNTGGAGNEVALGRETFLKYAVHSLTLLNCTCVCLPEGLIASLTTCRACSTV